MTDIELANSLFMASFNANQPTKMTLRNYLDQYSLAKEDETAVVNFISVDPEHKRRYSVPDDVIPKLMELLNNCHKENVPNQILEVQDVNNARVSGIFFEFVFESESQQIAFECVVAGFIRILFNHVLAHHLDMSKGKQEHCIFYLKTQNPIYTPSQKFRSCFRIIIPSVLLDPDVRFFIYQRIWQSCLLKELFKEKLNYNFRHCFQRSMRVRPITVLGSFDESQIEPMVLAATYKIEITNGYVNADFITNANTKEWFSNVVYEASINYIAGANAVVCKNQYLLLPNSLQKMKAEAEDDQLLFQMAYDRAMAIYTSRLVTDSDIKATHDVLNYLDEQRFEHLDSWLEIIRSLAAATEDYHCLAVMVTKDRIGKKKIIPDDNADEGYRTMTWEEFNGFWLEANKFASKFKYSFKSLRYWATCDNPSEMRRYINDTLYQMVTCDVAHSVYQAHLQHRHFAVYLHFMFKNIYITYTIEDTERHGWYEFVTPLATDIEPGQLYKWRCIGSRPDSLSEFISNDLETIMIKVHGNIKAMHDSSLIKLDKDDPRIKYIFYLYKTFKDGIRRLGDTKFKQSVIKESASLFKSTYFIKQLDKEPHILGVGNGVIEFDGSDYKLLSHYHTYPISLFTDTCFIPYDEDNKYIVTVYKMLRSLVPENEADALDFLLYYLSTSLDWYSKESLFFIIHGGGCHAENTPIRMFDGSIRLVQDICVGDELMGDDNTKRIVQQLFRGMDEMVEIIPTKGHAFVVNIHHILSLKFDNLNTVTKFIIKKSNRFRAIWYERNGNNEPIRKSRVFRSKRDAMLYFQIIAKMKSQVIKQGDIINIRVVDLLKWSRQWLTNGKVLLYQPGAIIYPKRELPSDPYAVGYQLKKIPSEYKIASIKQRANLLAGVLDASTFNPAELPCGYYLLELTNQELFNDCFEIAQSLGYSAVKLLSNNGTYSMRIYGNHLEAIPCRKRRLAYYSFWINPSNLLTDTFAIRQIGEYGRYFGFELDGNHRYLTGDYYVHHNSNGKSVLLELFRRTLGELYVRKLPLSFITDQSRTRASSADPAMMELKYARLAYYSESDRNEKANIAKIKEVTGGEALSGRALYKNQENFRANCNHIVTTNHRFVIETNEHAVWRRFICYKFKMRFIEKIDPNMPYDRARNPELIKMILDDKRYHEAFLAILLHYRKMLYDRYNGQILRVPNLTIRRETDEYRQKEDIFERFIVQRVCYQAGRQQTLDEVANNFRMYYQTQYGEKYKMTDEDLIHIFRNSSLGCYVQETNGMFVLDNLYTLDSSEPVQSGLILFSEWRKTNKK